MSNNFYEYNTPVNSGTTIRSSKYNAEQQGVETGFEAVQVETDRSLKFQSSYNNTELPEILIESFIVAGVSGLSLYPVVTFNEAVQNVFTKSSEASSSANIASTKASEALTYRNEAKAFRDEAETFSGSTAQNSLRFGGELPSYYATAQNFADLSSSTQDAIDAQNANIVQIKLLTLGVR